MCEIETNDLQATSHRIEGLQSVCDPDIQNIFTWYLKYETQCSICKV